MNDTLSAVLLLSAPGLPLLLAFPALRSRLSWPCHIALLPALILLAVPAVVSIEVPWLLFGTGFGLGGSSRLLLAMSVVLWAAAATLLYPSRTGFSAGRRTDSRSWQGAMMGNIQYITMSCSAAIGKKMRAMCKGNLFVTGITGQPVDNRLTTFFLLTMAGHLGAIMATGLVGFFTFSTLMGYGLYGLLVDGGDDTARRAGRVYLGFLILADLVLFEALLIAAETTGDLGFEAVHHAMTRSPSPGLYLSMVLVGFVLKAGVWPLHFWLPLAFRSARPAVALLLGGVPVAIGLLGMVRWFSLGDISLPGLGSGIQGAGLAAAIYGTIAGLMQSHPRALLAYVGIVVTGLFVATLGAGLEWPMVGSAIKGTAHLSILYLGFVLAALVSGSLLPDKAKPPLLVAGHGAGALLLALSPMATLFLTRIPGGGDSPFADSRMVALWPWWTLCTTLLAVRWLYLRPHRQTEVSSVPAPMIRVVWGVLLAAAYGTGLLACVWSDDPAGVITDMWWPWLLGILIGGSAWWMAAQRKIPSIPAIAPGDLWPTLEKWLSQGNRWVTSMGLQVLPRWRASGLSMAGRLLKPRAWKKAVDAGERSLQGWTLAVTLLLLLGFAIALLST